MGGALKRVAGALVLATIGVVGAFVLGTVAPWTVGAPDVVHVGGGLSFRPADQPLLHGLFYAVNLAVLEGAVLLGLVVAGVLWRAGLLFHTVALGLAGSGLFGLAMAVFGGYVGMTGDQRGGMGVVAVTLGGMGGLMVVALIKDRLQGRKRAAHSAARDR